MFEIDKSTLPFVRTRQALLVLDLQNEFSPSGQLPVEQPPNFVDNILRLLPDFRISGNVIWIRSVFEASRPVNDMEGDTEEVVTDKQLVSPLGQEEALRNARKRISETMSGRAGKAVTTSNRVLELANTIMVADEDVETAPEEAFLTVSPGEKPRFLLPASQGVKATPAALEAYDDGEDILFEKSYYSAFKDGTLVQFLRSRFITEIYICGALTNMSVYATVVDAAQFGLAITLVDDCLGYRSRERHDESLRRLLVSTGCDNISSPELIQDLKQKARTAQRQAAPAPRPVRREPSKPKERKAKEPELESMMSKLNLIPDNSLGTGNESLSPTPRLNPVPSLVPDTESGGSFESIESESQDLQLPSFPTKGPRGDDGKPEKVATKIRARERTSTKRIANTSTPISTDGAKPNSAEHPAPVSKASSHRPETAQKRIIREIVPEVAEHSTSDILYGKSAVPKLDGTEMVQRAPEKPTQSAKSSMQAPTMKVERPSLRAEEGPSICEGDTTIITNLLKGDLAEGIFEKIRDEVRWQKMSHQGGDVPRLVAVQGKISEDGSIPIYRHPSDESPPLLPFSPMVSLIREQAEKEVGHPLNHALIQFYRDGSDYISEHSDKTLDIAPKTFIVNVSLGAQRTMIFRTKKQQSSSGSKATEPAAPRRAMRAPMPHNSMCKVGLVTNMRWLHGIRQDKRLPSEKSNAELAYDSSRISLTFRQIGTFLSKDQQKIWGQGAVSKSQNNARFVVNGNTPEAEKMIRAFGQENHLSEFDWADHYGSGFDVLHLNNTPKLFLSGDSIANSRVKLALADHGIKWEEGKLSSSFIWKDGDLSVEAPEIPRNLPVKFVDNDLSKSTTIGDMAILLYLDAVYGPKGRTQLEIARIYSRLQYVAEMPTKFDTGAFDGRTRELAMRLREHFAKEESFLAGNDASIIDWMMLPLLDEIHDKYGFSDGLEAMETYYARLRATESVVAALGPLKSKGVATHTEKKGAKKELKKEVVETADDDNNEDEDNEDEDS